MAAHHRYRFVGDSFKPFKKLLDRVCWLSCYFNTPFQHYYDDHGQVIFEIEVFHLITAEQVVNLLRRHQSSLRLKKVAKQYYRFDFMD